MWYFYILQSQKNKDWFYKGSTNNINYRLNKHNNGLVVSTRNYRPLKLVYFEAYLTEKAVREREASVKRSGSISVPLLKRIKKHI